MQPDTIDSEPGDPGGHAFGLFVGREVRGGRQVRSVQPDPALVVHKMSVLNPDESVLSGWSVQQETVVDSRSGLSVGDDEREQSFVRRDHPVPEFLGGEGDPRQQGQGEKNDFFHKRKEEREFIFLW